MMKTLRLLSFVVFAVLAVSMTSCQVKGVNNAKDDDAITEFITDMYDHARYEDYAFLEQYCSKELLERLAEAYDYDSDGVAYASWKFRTEAQDGKPGSDQKYGVVSVKPVQDGWCEYEFYDGGWKGKTRVRISHEDGRIVMESIEKVYDECLETYN